MSGRVGNGLADTTLGRYLIHPVVVLHGCALNPCRHADCGAGIGRVTKHLLLERFDYVDIVEQSPRLLQAAPKYVGRDRDRTTCVCVGLQVKNTHNMYILSTSSQLLALGRAL